MTWAPDYVTADQVADFAHVDDDVDDVDYARVATTASRSIDDKCNRQFGRVATAEARFYTPLWSHTRQAWVIETDDYISLTEVAIDPGDGTWATIELAKVIKLDANAPQKAKPYERCAVRRAVLPSFTYAADAVRVTGIFGWASVPVAIEEAALLQASRLAVRRDSPLGVAGSPDSGSELRLLARLDPDVLTSIKPYIRRVLP